MKKMLSDPTLLYKIHPADSACLIYVIHHTETSNQVQFKMVKVKHGRHSKLIYTQTAL